MQASVAPVNVSVKDLAAELLTFWHYLMKGGAPALYKLLDELDLSMTQIKCLHALEECMDPISVKDLSERLGMSLPTASRTADLLLRRGLLERHEDEQDRRIKRVTITPAGRDVVDRIDTIRLRSLEDYAQILTPEQRAALHDALSSLPHKVHP